MQQHDDFDDLSSLSPTLSNFLADSEWAASFNSLGLDSEEQLLTHSEFQVKEEEEEEEEVLTPPVAPDSSLQPDGDEGDLPFLFDPPIEPFGGSDGVTGPNSCDHPSPPILCDGRNGRGAGGAHYRNPPPLVRNPRFSPPPASPSQQTPQLAGEAGGSGANMHRHHRSSATSAGPNILKRSRLKRLKHRQLPPHTDVSLAKELVRMAPLCLRSAHKKESDPLHLFKVASKNVNPQLFQRQPSQADVYSSLEEITISKNVSNGVLPFHVATSTTEAAALVREVWSAQRSVHLAKVMIRPPYGPDRPSRCLIEKPSEDDDPKISFDDAMAFANDGVRAAPKHCGGLPPQCADWIDAPVIAQTPLKSDFHLLARNVGRLRRNGYCHVISSAQLSCIAVMPGSIAVKWLMVLATLLGQPLVANTLHVANNNGALLNVTPAASFVQQNLDNPTPELAWHPNAPFQKHDIPLKDTTLSLILGYLPVFTVAMPSSQRRLLRMDRIVDLKALSVLQHNVLRYTRQALDSATPMQTKQQFRILDPSVSTAQSIEYFLHDDPLSAESCRALALSQHGRLPSSLDEVKFATGVILDPAKLWINTEQSASKCFYCTGKYSYRLSFGTEQLLPTQNSSMVCTLYHTIHGEAREVTSDSIGSQYIWYQQTGRFGQYHVYNPWRLEAAVSPSGNCSIFIPPSSHSRLPTAYHQRCLVLRNGTHSAVHQQQLVSALKLQQRRLMSLEGLPSEARLENDDHSLGPMSLANARLVQPLQQGPARLILESTKEALAVGQRARPLSTKDFRPLVTRPLSDSSPQPTPAALLALGSSLLTTAGSFVVSGVTQEVVTGAMEKIVDYGRYRFIDPYTVAKAASAPSRQTYLQQIQATHNSSAYSWKSEAGVLLLDDLRLLGHLPPGAAMTQAQLSSGLKIISAAADTLERFNTIGIKDLEKLALDFLAESNLRIDPSNGALAYVLRSGSIALVSYYLSTVDQAPAVVAHQLHALPAFFSTYDESYKKVDLPGKFQLTHLPASGNASAAQTTCARALLSQDYEAAVGEQHPACVTIASRPPMVSVLLTYGEARIVQTVSPPSKHIIGFLACSGHSAKRFRMFSNVNLFLLPASCAFDLQLQSKVKSVQRVTGEPSTMQFSWILGYNASLYHQPLTPKQQAFIALYSISGVLIILVLLSSLVLLKYKHLLPCVKTPELDPQAFHSYRRATIYHPHRGARSLDDFDESSQDSLPFAIRPRPPGSTLPFPSFVSPATLRNFSSFGGYQATVRRQKPVKNTTNATEQASSEEIQNEQQESTL